MSSGIRRGSLRSRSTTLARPMAVLVAAGTAFAIAATPSLASPPAAHSAAARVLSNETTKTVWTVPNTTGPIRTQPSPRARALGRLRMLTPDGYLQSYVLLLEQHTASGNWVELRVPSRPNGRVGWVPRSDLNNFQVVHTEIVVDLAARRLTVFRRGRQVFSAPVGVGKPSTPTPRGHFWITEGFVSTDPFYGPYLLATSDYSVLTDWPGGGIVGIHGTDEPSLVPGDPSHGCIRLHNADILRLSKLVSTGTPVLIQ